MSFSSASESAGASAVKVAAVGAGALVSSLGVSNTAQFIVWVLTVTYSLMQVIKGLPWFTDYVRAAYRGIRHKDWSHWWTLARRDEQGGDKNV